MKRSKARALLLRLLALWCAGLIALVVGELAIRLVAPQPQSWLSVYRRHPHLPFHALMPDVEQTAHTGETDWTVCTDHMGFRRARTALAGGDYGVMWVGDSFAFGHGVDFEESFIGLLAIEGASRVRHWDTAVPGYGPVQYEQIVREYVDELRPALVMVCLYVGNDFHDCIWTKDLPVTDGILGKGRGLTGTIKANSHLYRLLAAVGHRMGLGSRDDYSEVARQLTTPAEWQGPFLTEAVARARAALRSLLAVATASGASVRAIVIPTREALAYVRDPSGAIGEPTLPVKRMLEILRDLGIDSLDTTEALKGLAVGDAFFEFDGHLTPVANARVAKALGERWPDLLTGKVR